MGRKEYIQQVVLPKRICTRKLRKFEIVQ